MYNFLLTTILLLSLLTLLTLSKILQYLHHTLEALKAYHQHHLSKSWSTQPYHPSKQCTTPHCTHACAGLSLPHAPLHAPYRARFSPTTGKTTVRAFPSKGGVYILTNSRSAELDFLNIDAHIAYLPRSIEQQEEDIFCQRMRMLGADYWYCEFGDWGCDVGGDYEMSGFYKCWDGGTVRNRRVWVGWPKDGGVWVLVLRGNDRRRRAGWRIGMARDMKERCRATELLGGRFFADLGECEIIKDLLSGEKGEGGWFLV